MKILLVSFCLSLFLLPGLVLGQLRLPQPSPAATIIQTIGLTEVTVKYHTPGVKGREVWGKLVPYKQVWRTGANESTLITFSDNVKINGSEIPAGTYSLFSQPDSLDSWQIILNKNTTLWGSEGYNPAEDVIRVKAQAGQVAHQETFQFAFSNLTENSGTLAFVWEKLQVSFTIETDTDKKALALLQEDLKNAKQDNWLLFAQATSYLIQKNTNHELALEWINKSLSINNNFYNNWVKAQLLAQKEEYEGAVEFCKNAVKLGKKSQEEYKKYESDIERNLSVWKFKRHDISLN